MMLRTTFMGSTLLVFGVLTAPLATAQTSSLGDIEKQLTSTYHTAKATADGTDIVTAGSVLVLQKDHLVMCKVSETISVANVYKGGALSQAGLHSALGTLSTLSKIGRFLPFGGGAVASAAGTAGQAAVQSGADASAATREFVAGEKFWVTQITTKSDGVYFTLLSDSINDQRYKATLQFPFAKGGTPSSDDVAALVGEVITIDAGEQTQTAQQQAPAPQPKTIAVGQTRDEVVAAFGVPTKVIKLATKEIDIFPDMKVTFVHDKVSNVE
jgi:hypothetical protein